MTEQSNGGGSSGNVESSRPVDASVGIAVVVIGRNEGERLRRCLESVRDRVAVVVYVDSGSTDGSVELAWSLGVDVVVLDTTVPFTAARGRNAGFERAIAPPPPDSPDSPEPPEPPESSDSLDSPFDSAMDSSLDRDRGSGPEVGNPGENPGAGVVCRYVQFVDGDCEVDPDWLTTASTYLDRHERVGVVCGRRRERYPGATIYNRLCDMEWDTPIGEAASCGGDAMMRVEAFRAVGGFDATVIAGEEPELCVRMRLKGWKISRIDAEMTLHDAQMTRFGQWWKRMVRSGHAYTQGVAMHGGGPTRHCVRQVRSIVLWGGVVPGGIVAGLILAGMGVWWGGWIAGLLGLGYWVLGWRVVRYQRGGGYGFRDAVSYAGFCVLGKFAQFEGMVRYRVNRLLKRRSGLIEYKGPSGKGESGKDASGGG